MNEFQPLQFGKYLILDKIATGGMAELYLSKIMGDQGFAKLVAIKKILPHLVNEEDLVKSFIDEAKLAAYLQHENIIQVYDFGSMEGTYFIAMEYLFGKDLRSISNKAKTIELPLNIENALLIATKVCAGLDYSHKLKDFLGKPLNIIHRDISPPNIFITYDGQVKIIDFGIAKCASLNHTTQRGFLKGKLAYMSPEQAVGKPIDHRSDIFSVGILLYEMVTQHRMFEGETMEVFARVRESDFEPPESIVKNLPGKLYEIIYRSLEKDPQYRYQTAGEMLADLEECIQTLPIPPSKQTLSDYMSKLFKEESLVEEYTLRKYFQVDIDEKPKSEIAKALPSNINVTPPDHTRLDTLERTILLEGKRPSWLSKQLLWYAGVPAALLLIGAVVFSILFFVRDPVLSKLDKGMEALNANDYPISITLFEQVLTERPSMREMIRKSYAQALRGQAYTQKETNPSEAKILLVKSLEMEPADARTLLELGYLYLKNNELTNAMNSFAKVNEEAPEFPDAQFQIGNIYEKNNNFAEAEKIYNQVIEMAPPFLDEALFRLAVVQDKRGDLDESIRSLEKALMYNPENQLAKMFLKAQQNRIKN
jgi:serine/threonine protein kinase/TolA-binding protein